MGTVTAGHMRAVTVDIGRRSWAVPNLHQEVVAERFHRRSDDFAQLSATSAGRDEEIRAIRSMLVQVTEGGGALVLSGAAGTQETELLTAAADAASTSGMKVLRGSGAELEADIGFAGLHQLVVPLLNELTELPSRVRSALHVTLGMGDGPPPDRLVVLDSVLALLRQAARHDPLLLVVDDLQWIDMASTAALGFVARRLAGSRVGLLAAIRAGSNSCITSFGLPTLQLRPLARLAVVHSGSSALERTLRPVTVAPLDAAITFARSELTDGKVDLAYRTLLTAIEGAASRSDPETAGLAEATHTLTVVCQLGGRPEMWREFGQALSRLTGTVPAALQLTVSIIAGSVCVPPALPTAAAPARAQVDGDLDPWLTVQWAMVATLDDSWDGCRESLRQVLSRAREQDVHGLAVTAGSLLASDAFAAGRWSEAAELARQSITLGETHGHHLFAWKSRSVLALIAAGRGDWDAAAALTDEMIAWAEPRGVRTVSDDAHRARSRAALGRGDFEAAYRDADIACAADPGVADARHGLLGYVDLVESAIRTHRHAAASAHAAAAGAAPFGWVSPRLALHRATVAALVAPDELAAGLFGQALAIPGIEAWPFEVARTQLAFGERLRRVRATTACRTQLSAALEGFTRIGARPWAERAGEELRAAGGRRQRPDRSGATPLTPQERGIAELAATGLTNKQIGMRLYLSPRTVSAHLYRIFPKLGITTRAALRDALRALPSEVSASGAPAV